MADKMALNEHMCLVKRIQSFSMVSKVKHSNFYRQNVWPDLDLNCSY